MTEKEGRLEKEFVDGISEFSIPYEPPDMNDLMISFVDRELREKYPYEEDAQFIKVHGKSQYLFVRLAKREEGVLISMIEWVDRKKWEIYSWDKLFEGNKVYDTREQAEAAAVKFIQLKQI